MEALTVPAEVTPAWCQAAAAALDAAGRSGETALRDVLPAAEACHLINRCRQLLHPEPTLLEVAGPPGGEVVVVGDLHGHFYDTLRMLEVVGAPSPDRVYVFDGDFVDRGSWGIETLALLAAWKLALPASVFLLRGNHETASISGMYGFSKELAAKYGRGAWKPVYTACRRLFAAMPLAAKVGDFTLVLHGGLYRRPPLRTPVAAPPAADARNRKRAAAAESSEDEEAAAEAAALAMGMEDGPHLLGTLGDLRRAGKGGQDPYYTSAAARLASDVLWSDPQPMPGFVFNHERKVGMMWGPDMTERFLRDNGLRLLLRGHEGPDARDTRVDDMVLPSMASGWALDHDTPAGKLYTVFSAPNYPHHLPECEERVPNLGAVAVLTAPDWCVPDMRTWAAVDPRPDSVIYYVRQACDESEEESEMAAPSDLSGGPQPALSDAGTSPPRRQQAAGQQQQQQQQQQQEQQQQQQQVGSKPAAAGALPAAAADEDASADTAVTAEGAAVPRGKGRGGSGSSAAAHGGAKENNRGGGNRRSARKDVAAAAGGSLNAAA